MGSTHGGTTLAARPSTHGHGLKDSGHGKRPDPMHRTVTADEAAILARAVNTFHQIVFCASGGWSVKNLGTGKEADQRELNELLRHLLPHFSTEEIQKRLAWVFDSEARYAKLLDRLDRVKTLLGNGGSEHPFKIVLGGSHVAESQAFTGGFRSGHHRKVLAETKAAWDRAKANAGAAASNGKHN